MIISNTKLIRSDVGKSILDKVANDYNSLRVFTSGSQGLRMMKVAESTADASIINVPTMCSSWDVCAPQAIVEAAGGYVAYLDGSPIKYTGRELAGDFIVARDQKLGEYLSQVVLDNLG